MRLNLSRFSRRQLAPVAVRAVAVARAAVIPGLPAFAATGCSVTYTATNWTESPGVGGFTANINITNAGDPLTSWTLRFTLPSGQTLTQGWSANWTSSGTAVTGTNLSYNGTLDTAASTGVAFTARWSGRYGSPPAFTLTGVACNGSPTNPPTTTPPVTSRPPTTTPPVTTPPTTTRPPTTTQPPTTTVPPCTTNCPAHVDNPFVGAKGYNNPEWASKA